MKKLIFALSLFALSCTKSDVQRNQTQQSTSAFSAQIITSTKVKEAGLDRCSLKLTVSVSRSDSATSIQVARADFAYFLDIPLKNGNNDVSDYHLSSCQGTITYVVKSVLITGQTTYSAPITINY